MVKSLIVRWQSPAVMNPFDSYINHSKKRGIRCSPTFGGVTFGTFILTLTSLFTFDQIISIGLNIGEYGLSLNNLRRKERLTSIETFYD